MGDQTTNGKDGPTGPSLSLLTKLMRMTTSSNDAEALVALRKANEQVAKFGTDWEGILKGKITVIGDPFATIQPVPAGAARGPGYTTTPPRHQTPPTYTAPSRPTPKPRPQPNPNASKPNQYPGACTCCNAQIAANAGTVRRNLANTGWDIWCSKCTQVGSVKAPKPPKDIHDILNRI